MKVPYHSHTNPEDEIAQAAAQIRHAELRFWCEHLPEFDNDIELAVQRMFSATGVSPARISKIFMALDRLESMPELHALQEALSPPGFRSAYRHQRVLRQAWGTASRRPRPHRRWHHQVPHTKACEPSPAHASKYQAQTQ